MSEQTGFQKHLEEEAARGPATSGLPAPKNKGPLTVQPVSFTDRPTVKDFRAVNPETAPPPDIAAEIEREYSVEDESLDPTDAPTGPTDPIETGKLSAKSPNRSVASPPSTSDGSKTPPVED